MASFLSSGFCCDILCLFFKKVSTFLREHRFPNKRRMESRENIKYSQSRFRRAARSLIEKIREADAREVGDVEGSFRQVMERVEQERAHLRKRRIRNIRWIASTAAAVGLVLAIGWRTMSREDDVSLDVSLLDVPAVTCGDEVTLVEEDRVVRLENEVSLAYDTSGAMSIRQSDSGLRTSQTLTEKNGTNRIMVPNGKRADITFADGTRIYINSGSKVIYPKTFDKRKREILVEGEVYLDVAKRKDAPFVVKTKDFDIQVLGTSFNVCAYAEDASSSVVLVRGSVEVTTGNKTKVELKPDQMINVRGNKTQVRKVDVSEYVSWKDNLLLLRQKPVGEILKRLERYYGCKIRYDTGIGSILLSGKLDLQEDIMHVMENLCLSSSLCYTMGENQEIYVRYK